jgi:hypothetical protein
MRTQVAAKTAIATCTDRAGCRFVQNDCYCSCRGFGKTSVEDGDEAEACDCFCGGGAPVACVPDVGGG